MSVVSDVLMEALDNRDITADEAAFIMRNYYSEGAVRDAVHNISRVMDASREDKASTIEQLKSNKGFSDAEKNVKSYCAKAYKTMTKYSRTIAIKDNANGKADMQNIINGINSAMTKYNSAKKAAEKSDHADITPVVNKIINNLKSAQKCFASDGTPNKEALKKLASNTRMEYGNLGAVNVDAKAPKPKEKESTNESALISFDNDVLSESFFSDMKNKISKKHDTQDKASKNTGAEKSPKKKDDPIGGIVSKVINIRTAANGAMGRKITALKKKSDDFESQDDIKQVNRSMTGYAEDVKSNIDKLGSMPNGKKYIPGLTKIMNYIKNAISSKSPNDIETFRVNMMGQTIALVESYQMESVNTFLEAVPFVPTMDATNRMEAIVQRFNYLSASYRTHMNDGDKSAAKKDLKEMQETIHTAAGIIDDANKNSTFVETTLINLLFDGIAIAGIAISVINAPWMGSFGVVMAGMYGAYGGIFSGGQIMNVINDYKKTGKFNYRATNAALGILALELNKMENILGRMTVELDKAYAASK